jgi:glucose-6-phosphate 1-dehydrogenase
MTMAEDFGVEDRGSFYDPVGAMRDVVQNHILQVLGLIAMEPPAGNAEDSVRDKKLELFKAVRGADPKRYVRGQYDGYRKIDGVDPKSSTETYAALELEIDNWRWSGTTFRLRSGKGFGHDRKEVVVRFRDVPHLPFEHRGDLPPNELRFGLEPESVTLALAGIGARAGALSPLTLSAGLPPPELPAYGRLLRDVLRRDPALSIRGDEAEESWRIVSPILAAWSDGRVPLGEYPAGQDPAAF